MKLPTTLLASVATILLTYSGHTAPTPGSQRNIFIDGSTASLHGNTKARESVAMDVNNSGVVVGFSGGESTDAVNRAFVWTASSGQLQLGTLGGASSRANAVNDSGLVAGTSELS